MVDHDDVAKRLDRRDGFRLVAYKEVGLPLFRLNCSITFQETSSLGAIEEFSVRAIAKGVDTLEDLTSFLGLPPKIVAGQVGQLVFDHLVVEQSGCPARYRITSRGNDLLISSSASKILKQQMPMYVDGVTRCLVPVDARDLWASKELEDAGIPFVAPTSRSLPKAADLGIGELNKVIGLRAKLGQTNLRAIRVDAVVGRSTVVFRRALAMAFKSQDGRRMSIAFAIDGRQSDEHEIEYERSGKVRVSSIFGRMFDADSRRRDVRDVRRELKADVAFDDDAVSDERDGRSTLTLRRPTETRLIPAASVRVLSVYEHAPLLRSAFESAVSRVLIVSPWIRANVVNSDFLHLLTSCLDRGVSVTIGFGIGRRDAGEREPDKKARESLEALSKSFENFTLVRKGNTHAKVLLVDSDYFVTTSFNWLSFRGDPSQPMREEEGTMVRDPAAVEPYYQILMSRMAAVT